MYQLRTLWWRSHAHAPTSSMVPVAAMPTTARMTNANVPTDRTMSVRFDILQTSFSSYVCDISAGPCGLRKGSLIGHLLPALASPAFGWNSSVLALRRDSRQRIGDDLCS